MDFEILSYKLYIQEPSAPTMISNAMNKANQVALKTTEIQALSSLTGEVGLQLASAVAGKVCFATVKEKLRKTLDTFVDEPDFIHMFDFVCKLGANVNDENPMQRTNPTGRPTVPYWPPNTESAVAGAPHDGAQHDGIMAFIDIRLPRWVNSGRVDSMAMYGAYLSWRMKNLELCTELEFDGNLTSVEHEPIMIPFEEIIPDDGLVRYRCQFRACPRCVNGRMGYVFRWASPLWIKDYTATARPGAWKPGESEEPAHTDPGVQVSARGMELDSQRPPVRIRGRSPHLRA
jgi:hypothetical protein